MLSNVIGSVELGLRVLVHRLVSSECRADRQLGTPAGKHSRCKDIASAQMLIQKELVVSEI